MTVALIDDDEAVLDSLTKLLENRGMAVKGFTSAEEFFAHVDSMSVSCIVSDVRMPGLSGLELQSELLRRGSRVALILITGHGDIAMAVSAVKKGAFDFIEKPLDDRKLMEAIRSACRSKEERHHRQYQVIETRKRVGELSHRQRQVMNLAAEGLSNKEIALRLNISPRTVENYRAWVMERMGAANLAELVRMVVQLETAGEVGAGTEDW